MLTNEQKAGAWDGLKDAMNHMTKDASQVCKKMASEFLALMQQVESKVEAEQKNVSNNEMQMKKDFAIKKLGEKEISTVCKFMDVDIKEFTKEELIKILSLQQRKWLESIGFKYEE